MSTETVINRSQVLAAATAIGALGLLTIPTPAHADPRPAPPSTCSQYDFNGEFIIQEGATRIVFDSHGTTASGNVNGSENPDVGHIVSGGIQGRNVDFTIQWDTTTVYELDHPAGRVVPSGKQERFTGVVGDDANVYGTVPRNWNSIRPLVCATPAAPPDPQVVLVPGAKEPPPHEIGPQTAAARLGVAANGPTTLPAGQTGTYTVSVSNPGDVGAPVELFISFNGQLQQTGQATPAGGFNCEVRNYAGGSASVHCTTGQFQSKATANIVVQGRGSAPGAGQLVVNINSSDPAAQFIQKSQQLNVSIS